MITFRLYGRGEAYIAAKVLSRAGFLSGFEVHDFAVYRCSKLSYVTAFVRFDKEKILEKSPVTEPDFILVTDVSVNLNTVLKYAKPKTILILNSKQKPKNAVLKKKKIQTFYVDASSISFAAIGNPESGIPVVGAFLKVFKKISLKNAKKAIELELNELQNKNMNILEEGYRCMKK